METKLIKIIPLLCISICFARQLDVEFISDTQWLFGMQVAGGEAFGNSIIYGLGAYGESSVNALDVVDIDIYLSQHPDSSSQAAVFYTDNFGEFAGIGTFPGSVWDVSDPGVPRRLNICFFEQPDGDLHWNPDNIWDGNLEYLLIMASDYGVSSEMYSAADITQTDVQYFCWFRRTPNQDWFASDPAIMEFRNTWEFSHFSIDVEETSATVFWEHEHLEAESNEVAFYYVNSRIENNESSLLVQEVPSSQHEYYLDGLQTGEIYQFSVVGMDHDGAVVVESDWISAMPYSIAVNTELLGHWDGALDPLVGASKYNDIWGYTSPEGNEYALIGTWDGTHIVDLDSGMDNPTQVGFIPGSFSTHRDIKTHGHYMYAGTEANRQDPYLFDETGEHNIIEQGVQVVDLSDPENAILVNEWDGVIQSHNLMEGNGYLYVMGSGYDDDAWGQADLIILDLEDPAEPVKVGEWNGEYLHDICIAGDRLYGAAIYVDRIYAIDISDKSDPQTINFWDGIPSSHACWVSDDGNLLFSASETAFGHIISWDVSNLFNVNMLDEWYPEFGEEWTVHNIFYKNGYIFASHYAFGMQIIDVRDPENMVTAGFYDTFTEYPAGMFDGAWGTFPYFESNRIIISDRSTGLYVVDFSNEGWAEPFISGDVNQDDTVNVLDILMIVAHIIEYAPLSTSQWQAADVNSDEIVNVLDIITIINIILYN